MANIGEDLRAIRRELRAIKAQNLVTEPADVTGVTPATASISGVPANDSEAKNYNVIITWTPSNTSDITPLTNCWLTDISVPSNDFGFDRSVLLPQEISAGVYLVVCPFIGVGITDTYSFGCRITSLVNGSVTMRMERGA